MNTEELTYKMRRLERRVDNIESHYEQGMRKLEERISSLEGHQAKEKVLLRVDDVTKILHLSPITIYKLTRAGKIPCHRLQRGGRLYFMTDELKAWIQDRLGTQDIMDLVVENHDKFKELLKKEKTEANEKADKS